MNRNGIQFYCQTGKTKKHYGWTNRLAAVMVLVTAFCFILRMDNIVLADETRESVAGKVYEFGEKDSYPFSDSDNSSEASDQNTYGKFSVKGNIINIKDDGGQPAFTVESGNLQFVYEYDDSLLNAADEELHLVNDKTKTVNGEKLDNEIMKGAIIIQTSRDQTNWVTDYTATNVFKEIPVRTEDDSIYSTTDIQLINGCYYRVIVVYKVGKKVGTSKTLLVFNEDDYEYQKYAEVYDFYACDTSEKKEQTDELKQRIGKKVNTGKDNGFSGENEIKSDDPHYGWELGQFVVTGYTSLEDDNEDNYVFLKNTGDKVTLWFNLEQDITKLNGKENLSISEDINGYDQYFETPKTNFGRGTLIIRYTDYEGKVSEPQIYTNYLEANVSVGADTVVQMFEEGDYEVALDYEILKEGKNILEKDKYYNYRIFFKFSIRNGNTMMYLFDEDTGNELANGDLAENGFHIDLAKSRYLDIQVKREIMNENAQEPTPDTRFNKPAKDGEKYIDPGIYTLTAKNKYTEETTSKTIYVGDIIMKAAAINDMSINQVNEIVQMGGTVHDDGSIEMPPEPEPEPEPESESISESDANSAVESETIPENETANQESIDSNEAEENNATSENEVVRSVEQEPKNDKNNKNNMIPIIGGAVVLLIAGVVIGSKISKRKQ